MPIAGNVFWQDDQGNQIKGDVKIKGREGSSEVLGFNHEVYIPSDKDTGSLTGTRKHGAVRLTKEFDAASPILAQACCSGKTLKQVKVSWYRINDRGSEEEYFRHTLSNVKVVKVNPEIVDVKAPEKERYGHLENIEMRYQTIQWEYLDGNIATQDSWDQKTAA